MAGPISDKFGRRDALMFACLWWLAGTALQVAVTGRGMLIAGRVLNGVTVGITSSQVPVYLAEISKHSQRGAIIIIQQLAIEWGILIMSVIHRVQLTKLTFAGTLSVTDVPLFLENQHRSVPPGVFSSSLASCS